MIAARSNPVPVSDFTGRKQHDQQASRMAQSHSSVNQRLHH